MTKTKTYDVVIRVSRKNGREGDSFMSPGEQIATTDKWLKDNGHKLGQRHDERDSVSGKTTERVGLQAALKRALAGKTDGIVVAKVDRFSRNMVEGLVAVKQLEKHGRDFIAVRDGLTGGIAEKRNPTANLLRGILFLLAEWQLDSLTDGWETVREAKIMAGIHLAIPFGYERSDGKASPLAKVEPDASYVHEAFVMRARGASWQKIADYLNSKCTSKAGNTWTLKRARALIHCDAYLGVARSGDFVKKGAHPAVVTQDEWDAAHARAGRRHAQVEGGYLLTGLVRCAACGYVMIHNDNGKGSRSYRCQRKHAGGECPNPASVNAPDIESMVVDHFKHRYGKESFTGHKLGESVADALAKVKAAKARHAIVLDAMPDDLTGAALDNWKAREYRERVAIADAEKAHNQARNDALGSDLPADLLAIFDGAPVPDRRAWIGSVFGLIAVSRRANGVALADRVRIDSKADAPTDLPGRFVVGLRPICVEDVARMDAGEVVGDKAA